MNLAKIFPNKESQNEAIEHFRTLKDDPAWIFLVEKLIKSDIIDIEKEIFDPKKVWKDGEEKDAKRRRAYWIILSQLPEKLIDALRENKPDILVDMDPYYRNFKEIEADNKKKR